jgi:hypothetical protein
VTAMDFLAPVIGTAAILALMFVIGALIHVFIQKTEMGARIKDATPWMGWYNDVDDEYTNFTIHPSNYYRTTSR